MDEKKALGLLRKYSTSPKDFRGVLVHSRGVQKYALEVARKVNRNPAVKRKADVGFIKIACILHDIGRFAVPPGKNSGAHGYFGGQILKKEGLDNRFVRVCETHIGYWVTKEDVLRRKMPIPAKNYKPRSVEEKIISYVDKLVLYSRRIKIDTVVRRYEKEMGKKYAAKLWLLHEEMMQLMEK
jgi:uncharacterized protein